MDQLIFASLSHTHYWYEVGMLKVLAVQVALGIESVGFGRAARAVYFSFEVILWPTAMGPQKYTNKC